jgi:hypothetical protein
MLIIYNIERNSYKENFALFIIIYQYQWNTLQNNANLICLTKIVSVDILQLNCICKYKKWLLHLLTESYEYKRGNVQTNLFIFNTHDYRQSKQINS